MADHQHSENCYSTYVDCGLIAHVHDSTCYTQDDGKRFLTCSRPSHVHSGGCYRKTLTCGK